MDTEDGRRADHESDIRPGHSPRERRRFQCVRIGYLDGVRGQPPADKAAVVDALLRVGQLVQDFPEIVELDINPLVVYLQGQGTMAIDMRLVLAEEPGKAEQP